MTPVTTSESVEGLEPRNAQRRPLRRWEVRLRARKPSTTVSENATKMLGRKVAGRRPYGDRATSDRQLRRLPQGPGRDRSRLYWSRSDDRPPDLDQRLRQGPVGNRAERPPGKLPPFLPDVPEIREDFADSLGEIQAFDSYVGLLLKRLEETGSSTGPSSSSAVTTAALAFPAASAACTTSASV